MLTLVILAVVSVVALTAIVLRVMKRTLPVEQRMSDWASRHGLQIVSAKKVADHSVDGLAGSGSPTFRLLLREANGAQREATIRFDVAVIGQDPEHVVWVS